jgi:hypothetical protein
VRSCLFSASDHHGSAAPCDRGDGRKQATLCDQVANITLDEIRRSYPVHDDPSWVFHADDVVMAANAVLAKPEF